MFCVCVWRFVFIYLIILVRNILFYLQTFLLKTAPMRLKESDGEREHTATTNCATFNIINIGRL